MKLFSFSDAKLRRISPQNKKPGIFFMMLLRQKAKFETKTGKARIFCRVIGVKQVLHGSFFMFFGVILNNYNYLCLHNDVDRPINS
jgi:hypothetical protein